jgi:organic radical activating enzyme
MQIKTIVDEDFINYKEPSMYIGTAYCNGKCCREAGIPISVCQNDEWRAAATIAMTNSQIIERYLDNDITSTVCFAGLEPFEQFDEMFNLISALRNDYNCDDTVVIYTGYREEEIADQVNALRLFSNIIIKFGRFIPNQSHHFDSVLGVNLASDNQYAEKIS